MKLPKGIHTNKKLIERVRFTGPESLRGKMFDYLIEEGYRSTRSGPYPLSRRRVDPSRFLIIAEREVQ